MEDIKLAFSCNYFDVYYVIYRDNKVETLFIGKRNPYSLHVGFDIEDPRFIRMELETIVRMVFENAYFDNKDVGFLIENARYTVIKYYTSQISMNYRKYDDIDYIEELIQKEAIRYERDILYKTN